MAISHSTTPKSRGTGELGAKPSFRAAATEATVRFQSATLKASLPYRERLQQTEDFRRIAIRYDKLARDYLTSICQAAVLA